MLDTSDLKIQERADKALKMVQSSAEQFGGALSGFSEEATKFVRARPGAVLAGALAVGFILGRFISRR